MHFESEPINKQIFHLISLNELVLPRFLYLVFRGQPVKILQIEPFTPKLKGMLERVVDWTIRSGRVEYAIKLAPELQFYWDYEWCFNLLEIFKKYESWQNRYYGFDREKITDDPVYGYAFKKMTCNYTFSKVLGVYLLDSLTKKISFGEYRIYGVLADTLALGRHLLGPDFAHDIKPMAYPKTLVRWVQTIFSGAYTLAWLAKRVRLNEKPEKIAIAFDYMKDKREFELLKEIRDAGRIVLIDRFPQLPSLPLPEGMEYQICNRSDGRFPPILALKSAAMAIRDIFKLARLHKEAPPTLFSESLSMPYKRLLVRGLLNRYQPKCFIGRDEYNVDHVLRRAELIPLGIKSIGINGGLHPCSSSLVPKIRYVNFDVFFTYAAPLYTRYRDTWPPDMAVKTIGSFSLPREMFSGDRKPKGEDILFTIRLAWKNPEMVRMVQAVARAFPDRKVYLQFKPLQVNDRIARQLVEECGKGVNNFVYTTQNVYTLLERSKYHISDFSTIVAEAIQSGMTTFLADLVDMEFTCFRSFPGLCVTTAEELVEKLLSQESGAPYPQETYFKLLGYRHGEIGFDLLRQEIGLPHSALPASAKRQ